MAGGSLGTLTSIGPVKVPVGRGVFRASGFSLPKMLCNREIG